jgi:hypothetical protein
MVCTKGAIDDVVYSRSFCKSILAGVNRAFADGVLLSERRKQGSMIQNLFTESQKSELVQEGTICTGSLDLYLDQW